MYLPSPKSKNQVMHSLERIMFALFWIIFWCVFLFSLPKLCKTSPFLICQPALFETPRHVRVHSGVVAASGAEGQRHRHQRQRRHQQGRRPHWWQMVAGNPPSLLGGWAPSEYSGYPGIQKTPLKQWVEHIYVPGSGSPPHPPCHGHGHNINPPPPCGMGGSWEGVGVIQPTAMQLVG